MSGVCEKNCSPELAEADSDIKEEMSYEKLITLENIWDAWKKFVKGKYRQKATQEFWLNLEYNLRELYHELRENKYCHGKYWHFVAEDTKRRDIFVARVKDRVVHQLLADYLSLIYSKRFYAYSCAAQKGKGVLFARKYVLKIIRCLQGGGRVWIGKLDVKKFFENVDHVILLKLVGRRVQNKEIFGLCDKVIQSYGINDKGLPLGNLTSQWFANIYMHEVDRYAKNILKIKYYARYNDDIIVLDDDKAKINDYCVAIQKFVNEELKLEIPKEKTEVICLPQTADILGLCTDGNKTWTRKITARKARRKLFKKQQNLDSDLFDVVCSYVGLVDFDWYI